MSKAAVLARIQRCFRAEEYEVSFHALEELAADGLSPEDLDCVILHGTIARRLTEDPRGVRYEVCGTSLDGRRACAVCRFVLGFLRVITVYVVDTDSIQ